MVADHFGRHPDAEIYTSLPGLGVDPRRPGPRRVRRRPRPLRRRQGPQELRRHLPDHPGLRHQEGRAGPLRPQPTPRRRPPAMGVLLACAAHPAPRAYYQQLRARGIGHHAALRQLANRLVGILHGCLKTGTRYDENTAWAHITPPRRLTLQEPGMSAAKRDVLICRIEVVSRTAEPGSGPARCSCSESSPVGSDRSPRKGARALTFGLLVPLFGLQEAIAVTSA